MGDFSAEDNGPGIQANICVQPPYFVKSVFLCSTLKVTDNNSNDTMFFQIFTHHIDPENTLQNGETF